MPEFTQKYLGYLLARCSYQVSAKFHQQLKQQGIAVLTWRILASLRDQPLTVNSLAEMVLVNQSTVSKALDRLEADKLLTRQRDPEFRSRTNIQLTASGTQLIDELIDIANESEQQTTGDLNPQELQQLRELLQRLI